MRGILLVKLCYSKKSYLGGNGRQMPKVVYRESEWDST